MSVKAQRSSRKTNDLVKPDSWIVHWELSGRMAGGPVDADLEVVEYFAYLHDCQRWSEGTDWLHGREPLNLLSRTGTCLISANHNSRNWSARWPVTPS